jgi:hypothetical protein
MYTTNRDGEFWEWIKASIMSYGHEIAPTKNNYLGDIEP